MNMNTKRTASFRLSETTLKELGAVARRHSISQADVIAVVVHCVYISGEVEEEQLNEFFEIARIS